MAGHATPKVVSPAAIEITEMIDRVIAARPGPNSTFAEQEAAAAAIEVEVLAELARREAAAAAIEVEVLAELARREAEAGSPGDKD